MGELRVTPPTAAYNGNKTAKRRPFFAWGWGVLPGELEQGFPGTLVSPKSTLLCPLVDRLHRLHFCQGRSIEKQTCCGLATSPKFFSGWAGLKNFFFSCRALLAEWRPFLLCIQTLGLVRLHPYLSMLNHATRVIAERWIPYRADILPNPTLVELFPPYPPPN